MAFATAGAKRLVLVGRTEAKLKQAASDLSQSHPAVQVQHVVADVTDAAAVSSLAASLETWDVLVQGAGYINSPGPAAQANVDDYWKAYEVCPSTYSLPRGPLFFSLSFRRFLDRNHTDANA